MEVYHVTSPPGANVSELIFKQLKVGPCLHWRLRRVDKVLDIPSQRRLSKLWLIQVSLHYFDADAFRVDLRQFA